MTGRIYPLTSAAPWLTATGAATVLAGLSLDVLLHRLDPTLAAREGVVAVGNPGHALAGVGLGLLVAGTLLSLVRLLTAESARSPIERLLLRTGIAGFAALAGAALLLTAWSGVAPAGHAHPTPITTTADGGIAPPDAHADDHTHPAVPVHHAAHD